MTEYTCYACAKKVKFTELRYECMCTKHMGVCKQCENVPMTNWITPFPEHHNMQKLHDLTVETKAFTERVFFTCGKNFGGFTLDGDSMIVRFYEGFQGEKDEEFDKFIKEKYGMDHEFLPSEEKRLYEKHATFLLPKQARTGCK
jgi:hypothetical protein